MSCLENVISLPVSLISVSYIISFPSTVFPKIYKGCHNKFLRGSPHLLLILSISGSDEFPHSLLFTEETGFSYLGWEQNLYRKTMWYYVYAAEHQKQFSSQALWLLETWVLSSLLTLSLGSRLDQPWNPVSEQLLVPCIVLTPRELWAHLVFYVPIIVGRAQYKWYFFYSAVCIACFGFLKAKQQGEVFQLNFSLTSWKNNC